MWAQSRTTQISEENNVLKVKLRHYLTSSMHTSIKLIVWQRLSRKNNPGSEHWKKESGEDSNLLAFPLQYVESSLGRTRQRELAEKGTGERQDSRERERDTIRYICLVQLTVISDACHVRNNRSHVLNPVHERITVLPTKNKEFILVMKCLNSPISRQMFFSVPSSHLFP